MHFKKKSNNYGNLEEIALNFITAHTKNIPSASLFQTKSLSKSHEIIQIALTDFKF